jgi:hypothetical protein
MFATGVAAADDYAGLTYTDATTALSDANLKGVIASRVGDTLPDDQCVVTLRAFRGRHAAHSVGRQRISESPMPLRGNRIVKSLP